MTNKEAVNILSSCKHCRKKLKDGACNEHLDGCFEAKQMAIQALEKQIPMKPISVKYADADGYSYMCPNECKHYGGYVCVDKWMQYAHCCGQAIDWTDVN